MLGVLGTDIAALDVIIVQHIRADTAAFVSILSEHGVKIRQVIGISYSVEHAALDRIRKLGLCVTVAEFQEIPSRLKDELTSTRSADKTIILDVGGYAAGLASEGRYRILGIVEETKQGLWEYMCGVPRVPVVRIADCRNKEIENIYVGRAIRDALLKLTEGTRFDARQVQLGIVGFGGIGENTCRWLSAVNERCIVFDCASFKMIKALAMGFSVCELTKLLEAADIVIGCTGQTCIPDDRIEMLRRPTMFVSASSKDIEFRNILFRFGWAPAYGLPHCEQTGDPPVVMAYRGRPINFLFRSLPIEIGDFMFCNMIGAVYQLIASTSPPGVMRIAEDLQDLASRIWAETYG
jgi:S-adenosylhomocysteine hydrolase